MFPNRRPFGSTFDPVLARLNPNQKRIILQVYGNHQPGDIWEPINETIPQLTPEQINVVLAEQNPPSRTPTGMYGLLPNRQPLAGPSNTMSAGGAMYDSYHQHYNFMKPGRDAFPVVTHSGPGYLAPDPPPSATSYPIKRKEIPTVVAKYLCKAKKNKNVVDFKHIKILLTGSSAAGKSSFCCLLFGTKFSAEYKSTDVMESRQALSVIKSGNEDERQAVTVRSFSMLKKEGEVVWFELDLNHQIKYLKSLLVSKNFHDQSSKDDKKSNDNDDDGNDDIIPKEPLTDIEKEILVAELLPDSLTVETVKVITVVDTGGQPEYIHLLPAINNYPTITFLVHDLTKRLDDPVQVRYKEEDCEEAPVKILNYSNLDMINLLMCFVSDSLEQPSEQTVPCISLPKKSYIGFVGTHYDKVKDDPTIIQSVDDKLAHIVNEEFFEFRGVLSPEKGIIHPVDNTTAGDIAKEDPQVKMIRSQIEHFTNRIESKTLPITWMILQLRIQELCTTHCKKYMTYEEYFTMAKESSLCDEEEIKASLIYFHFIGTLLHFQQPGLCSYIVVNLQWLYTSLAKVMHLSVKDVTIYDHNLRKKFEDQRLLAKDDDCKINLKDISEQELEYLFNLLVHLKVIATVRVRSTDFYYLPCVLTNLKMCDDKHKHLLSEPLLIQFKSGFLPRGFFCSLVVHLLKSQPKGWEHQLHNSAKNFSDLMIFCLPDKTFLYMHDKIFYLKVEVRHSKRNFNAPYHSKLFCVLYQHLMMVCTQLCFDPQKLQIGFLCLANESDGEHIAVIDLAENSESMPNEVECSRKCSNVTKLDESHSIWFEEVVCKSSQNRDVHSKIRSLKSTPTMNELNHYVVDIAPSYYDIGLGLDIVNSQLKLIKSEPSLHDLTKKCQKMLEVWLESDTSASWEKLCNVLEENQQSMLAEKIKKQCF